MRIQHRIAIILGKIIFLLSRALRLGGGSAAPGLVAQKISPKILNQCILNCDKRVVITGTNGKTTTTQLLVEWLRIRQRSVITNKTGSNLSRGIVSAFISQANLLGSIKKYDYAIFELDEAEFSRSLHTIKPQLIVFTNLFRDQLDRYGEVNSTKIKWLNTLNSWTDPITIIFNSADPQINHLVANYIKTNKQVTAIGYFAQTESPGNIQDNLLNPIQQSHCPECNTILTFSRRTIIGQGNFQCAQCGFRNIPHIITSKTSENGFRYDYQQKSLIIRNIKPDTIMSHNITAAISASIVLENITKDWEIILKNTKATFGRCERIKINSCSLIIALVKNPTGYTETLKSIFQSKNYYTAAFFLNDNFADGLDVSWIWDVYFEDYLPDKLQKIYIGGNRKYDMALRLQYSIKNHFKIIILKDTSHFIDGVQNCSDEIPVFATYTAMLDLQSVLTKKGFKKAYWR